MNDASYHLDSEIADPVADWMILTASDVAVNTSHANAISTRPCKGLERAL
jgi:hypothetical protein